MNINNKKNWSERNNYCLKQSYHINIFCSFFSIGVDILLLPSILTHFSNIGSIYMQAFQKSIYFCISSILTYRSIQEHKHTEMKHCFTTQELSNWWPQHRSTVSMAWVRCSSWPLQLELPSFTAMTDKLPQHDRPPISQLSRPVSELVPSIPVWQRERTRQNERATHKFHKLYFWGCSISQTKNIIKNRLRKSNKLQFWLQWNRIGDREQTARDLSNKILCNRIQREGRG